MKLYATIESERAKKGQGGNKFLDLKLTYKPSDGGEPFEFMRFEVLPMNDGIAVRYLIDDSTAYIEKVGKLSDGTKAKRQKGEMRACDVCSELYEQGKHSTIAGKNGQFEKVYLCPKHRGYTR